MVVVVDLPTAFPLLTFALTAGRAFFEVDVGNLGHERVVEGEAAPRRGLEGAGGRREAARGLARDVGIAQAVHCNGPADVKTGAAEVAGVDQWCGTGRIQLGHEGVGGAAGRGLEGIGGRGEIEREGLARHVGAA